MNQLPTMTEKATAISAMDAMLNADIMNHINNLANVMAQSKVTVPNHLQGSIGDCFAVVLQSMQWGMNPFAVAQKTHLVNGVLGYEAQLVNAVITTRAPTQERLQFEWFGGWERIIGRFKEVKNANGKNTVVKDWTLEDEKGLGVKVWATIKGETEPRVLELLLSQAGVRNSPLWGQDPKQQLAYLAIKRWARLYCPDVILGVYTPDEFNEPSEIDITPENTKTKANSGASALKARLKKTENVVDVQEPTVKIDVAPYHQKIQQASDLEQLKAVADEIAKLNLGEPEKTDLRTAYNQRKEKLLDQTREMNLPILDELENATSVEQLNQILAEKFEPFTSQMNEQLIEQVTNVYERKVAELTD